MDESADAEHKRFYSICCVEQSYCDTVSPDDRRVRLFIADLIIPFQCEEKCAFFSLLMTPCFKPKERKKKLYKVYIYTFLII